MGIEQRALEIMSEYIRHMKRQARNHRGPILDPSHSLATMLKVREFKVPDFDADDEEETEDDGRPVALVEVRRRTAEKISRHHQGMRLANKRKDTSGQVGSKSLFASRFRR